MLAELSSSGTRIVLSEVNPHRDAPRVKVLFGSRWDPRKDEWSIPATWPSAVMLRNTLGAGVTGGPELKRWSAEQHEHVLATYCTRTDALDPAQWPAPGEDRKHAWENHLYGWQCAGVRWLDHVGSGILGDDMGLGKTVQTCVSLSHRVTTGPVLVVAPRGVLRHWAESLRTWCGWRATVVEHATAAGRERMIEDALAPRSSYQPVLVMTYDTLRGHVRHASYGNHKLKRCEACGGDATVAHCEVHPHAMNKVRWGTVVFDEAHKLRNPKSQQTRAAWWVADHADRRIGLTGTPLDKTPDEVWSLWRTVAPAEVPSRVKFIDRWCETRLGFWDGLEVVGFKEATRDEFRQLWELRWLRRPMELAAPDLPRLTHEYRWTQMTASQKRAYDQLADSALAEVEGGQLWPTTALELGLRLGQLSKATCKINPDQSVEMSEPSGTLDELETVLEELGDAPVVVASASRQLLTLAQARLDALGITHRSIVGGMNSEDIALAAHDYGLGKARVLLLSIGAGAEGLNITRGSTIVFISHHWQAMLNAQAIGRIRGIGRGDPDAARVVAVHIVTEGTYDEYKIHALGEKALALDDFTGDTAMLQEYLCTAR